MKKYKYNKEIRMYVNVQNLCEAYDLNEEIYKCILDLVKKAYIKGVHDTHDLLKK